MKVFVVLEDPGYGEYVHLVKAESVEEAKNVVRAKAPRWSTIEGASELDNLLSLLNDNDSICIGGYAE